MEWFYAANGQQTGPVSDAQLDELIRTGIVKSDTLVWREGQADWQPLQTARPVAAPPPIPTSATLQVCAECKKHFAPGDMIFLNQAWVCAACKPIALQRLREGVPIGGAGGAWRSGKLLVVRPDAELPDRCVKCNNPANGSRLKRRLFWHTPVLYLLVLLNLLVYLLVALCVRKRMVVHVGLCDKHRTRRKEIILGSWAGFFLGVGMAIVAGVKGMPLLGVGGGVLIVAAIFIGLFGARVVTATKITKENAWIRGVNPAYLAELPEWTDF